MNCGNDVAQGRGYAAENPGLMKALPPLKRRPWVARREGTLRGLCRSGEVGQES